MWFCDSLQKFPLTGIIICLDLLNRWQRESLPSLWHNELSKDFAIEIDYKGSLQSLTLCESVWAWLGEWGGWEAGRDNGGEGAGASRRGGGGAPRGLLGVDGRELLGVTKQVVDCDSLCWTIFWHAETIQNHARNWMFYKTSRLGPE